MRKETQYMRTVPIIILMATLFGCAASLSNLQRAEQQYQIAEAEKKEEEERARAAQAQADAARQAEATASQGLATALIQDADERVKYVEDQLRQAEAQRKRACELNPKLDICKVATPPPANPLPAPQPVAMPQPAAQAPAPAPPQQSPPAEPFVDVKMNDFSQAGMQRLTPLPVGWEVGYNAAKGELYLKIDGVQKHQWSKPAQFKAGICYRFKADTLITCPAAPPVQPMSGPQPGTSP